MTIDEHRALRYEEMIDEGIDLSNTYTDQEGCVFYMDGATCPCCNKPSKLAHRVMPSGYFACPHADTLYDEPNFDPDDFITNVDED